MFSKLVATIIILVASIGFCVPSTVGLLPRQEYSSEVTSFVQSWQSLAQSFSQCQSSFSQHASYEEAYQSVQTLYSHYQSTVNQYNSCSSCSTALRGYSSQMEQSTSQMFRSFQSIVQTGQQNYGSQWQSPQFQRLSSFGSFCRKVCSPIGIDLNGLLGRLGINLNLFANLGINLHIGLLRYSGHFRSRLA